ncbi:MAG: endonuclease V [Deltaproteobacteria bacterium]|nr:endonuclease V [Deltaproteobacteria bacterium]
MKNENLHRWDLTPAEAVQIQNRLARKLVIARNPAKFEFVAGADAAFRGKMAYGAAAVLTYPGLEKVAQAHACREIGFPYVPGLLGFREGPVLLDCFAQLDADVDLVIFDGHGIAHPRGFGLASHLGLLLGKPAVGCAKKKLFGSTEEPGPDRGCWKPIFDNQGNRIGITLRTRNNVKPVFVSPGYKTGLEQSKELVLSLGSGFRIPEPLRIAHHLALLSSRPD